jgi:hypothetical protein
VLGLLSAAPGPASWRLTSSTSAISMAPNAWAASTLALASRSAISAWSSVRTWYLPSATLVLHGRVTFTVTPANLSHPCGSASIFGIARVLASLSSALAQPGVASTVTTVSE